MKLTGFLALAASAVSALTIPQSADAGAYFLRVDA
jgi:hypothetical protein